MWLQGPSVICTQPQKSPEGVFFAVLYWTEMELQEWTACVLEKDLPCVHVCFNDTFVVLPLIIRLCHHLRMRRRRNKRQGVFCFWSGHQVWASDGRKSCCCLCWCWHSLASHLLLGLTNLQGLYNGGKVLCAMNNNRCICNQRWYTVKILFLKFSI